MFNPPGTEKCECGYVFLSSAARESFRKPAPKKIPLKIFNIFAFRIRPVPKTLLLLCVALLVITYFLKDRLPGIAEISPQLYLEPVQKKENIPPPFEITQKGFTYIVVPLYSYELYGLVASYHNSDEFLDYYHEKWKDYLNIKDLCVIWGINIKSRVYKEVEFSSRDFTCHYSYPDAMVKRLFSEDCLSNNHILADKENLKKQIMSVKTGDQVYFKGYLVNYGHKGSRFLRLTSEERTDRGNKSCEIVYVTEFKILKKANTLLRSLNRLSIYLIIGLLIFLLVDLHLSQPDPGDERLS